MTINPKLPDFNETVSLNESGAFAEGGNRLCFVHPQDARLCIKVSKPGAVKKARDAKPLYKRARSLSAFDDNMGEFKAYHQSAIRHPRVSQERLWAHLPRCYGWQNTSLGLGLVSDFYQNENGEAAASLEHLLINTDLLASYKKKLLEFSDYLRETGVLTKNILPHNLVLANDGRLKLIDGLGRLGFIPTVEWSEKARRNYIERRIKKMFLRVEWEFNGRERPWNEVEKKGRL
ncbi:PhoP regulatory network protein YrbL [Litorimonas taeanensis]|uniref:PhoP regulatory network protein YrbL n=1 Tax=Litorimonas taeanensis TaxID=568099 RepID=A0A420WJX6_9PROT|nr:YrbL family protein [Litorimonas taeanensis]RKQ71320.1 PhoP regulatory network protein YrbL [Litorimonas taeanensis]